MEANNMKKFFSMFEDLWVAVAFAESGCYESDEVQPLRLETAPQQAA